jgi:anaerobic selenocysteine-containing dehydrogenase
VWADLSPAITGTVYDNLYGTPYGGFDGLSATGPSSFALRSGSAEKASLRALPSDTVTYTTPVVTGSEWVCETVYREMCSNADGGTDGYGTIWIYNVAYCTTDATLRKHSGQSNWATQNRAKSRDGADPNGTLAYPGWGYSWLVNRRVLYNNGEVPGDIADNFMGPDSCARLYVSDNPRVLNYTRWYRTVHRMADKPGPVVAENSTTSLHYVTDPNVTGGKISYAGRFPAHTEPYESPRVALSAQTAWGTNTKGTAVNDLIPVDTLVGTFNTTDNGGPFPLVLTTIRCVEHFQGGPITRNNSWNVEAEPVPWIEINSVDARAKGINDGDWVNVTTARSNSTTNQMSITPNATGTWARGFKARVGSGLQSNQRVAQGVVAIPWHWGDQGLGTGSRANDLCIDAMDANTTIPEYKACLCKIEKL